LIKSQNVKMTDSIDNCTEMQEKFLNP